MLKKNIKKLMEVEPSLEFECTEGKDEETAGSRLILEFYGLDSCKFYVA
jgi:hypothetical protein